jgi:hypothetical protein
VAFAIKEREIIAMILANFSENEEETEAFYDGMLVLFRSLQGLVEDLRSMTMGLVYMYSGCIVVVRYKSRTHARTFVY